jgi:hypothetical protein
MTNPLPTDVLEVRAADQRRQLHNAVTEFKSAVRHTVREKLDVQKNARQYLGPAAGVAGLVGLVLGYGFMGMFTRR